MNQEIDKHEECPECHTLTPPEDLETFGGYCENCATDRLFE